MTTLRHAGHPDVGLMAYGCCREHLPNVDFPTIQVNASLPGASPETMGVRRRDAVEKQFSTIAGWTR